VAGPEYAIRRDLFDFVVAELRARESACPHRIRPVRTLLENQVKSPGSRNMKISGLDPTAFGSRCLRREGYLSTTQDLLPAAGQALLGGIR